ncbi:EpsG family protein [Aeromonas caviae]
MIYLFISIFFFLSTLFSLVYPKKAVDKVFFSFLVFFIITFLLVIFGFGYENVDRDNYIVLFDEIKRGGGGFITSQMGLVFIFKVFIFLGLSFQTSIILIFLIGIAFIHTFVVKYAKNVPLVYLFYFIYPFFLDVVQIKHFLAMSILIFATARLFSSGDKLPTLLLYLLAACFHYIAIFFIPLLFLSSLKIRLFTTVVIMLTVIIFFIVKYNLFLIFLSSDAILLRVQSYLDNAPKFGFLIQIAIQIAILLFVLQLRNKIDRFYVDDKFINFIVYLNVYLIIMLPFYMINGNFERVYRVSYIPNFVYLTLYLMSLDFKDRLLMILTCMGVMIALSSWYFSGILDLTIYPIIQYNYFFDFFDFY